MRTVIFGGTGNIGTALVRRLVAAGHDVSAVARRTPQDAGNGGVDWVSADVTVDDLDRVVAGADAVVHLAWLFQPVRYPRRTWNTNVAGTERILAAVARAGIPALVYSSSVAAYSPRTGREPVDEDFPTHGAGVSAYAREKAYVERLLDTFELRNPRTRTVRIRPAFVFQREAAAEQWRLFIAHPRLRRLFDTRLIPALPLPPDLLVQAVHAPDLIEAYAAAIEGTASGAYNVAADDLLDPADVAALLNARAVDVPARRLRSVLDVAWKAHASKAPPDLFDTLMNLPVMSNERAKAELGWRPEASAADAIGSFLNGTAAGSVGPTPLLKEDPPAPPGETVDDIDPAASKERLYRMAQEHEIPGRSSMSKQELVDALRRTAGA